MRKFVVLFALLAAFFARAGSYWGDNLIKQTTAQYGQEYWIWPGTNIVFSYASNHFIINTVGNLATTNMVGSTSNGILVYLTNVFYLQSNPSNYINNVTNYIKQGTNIVFRTNAGVITISVDGSLATNSFAGITNALHYYPATNNSGPWYVISGGHVTHTNITTSQVRVYGSGSAVAMQITGGGNGGFATIGQLQGLGAANRKTFMLYDSSLVGPPYNGMFAMYGDTTEHQILGEFDSCDRSLGGDQRRAMIQFGKDIVGNTGSDILLIPDLQVGGAVLQVNDNGGVAIGLSAEGLTVQPEGLWVTGPVQFDNDAINSDGAGSLFAAANVNTPQYITDDINGIRTNLIVLAGPSIYRTATFSNGIIVKADTVLYTNAFGAIALTNTGSHLTLAGTSTYTTITNWDYLATNRFTGMPPLRTDGSLTNVNAGMYRIAFSLSCYGAVGNEIEADVALNNVPSEFCAGHSSSGTASKNTCLSGVTVMYLAANTRISLMVKNLDSTTLTITHAQLTVGSP